VVDAERVSGGSQVGRVIPNAPLRLPERQRLFHTPPSWVGSGETFFITICCVPRGANQLANIQTFKVLSDAFQHYAGSGKLWMHLLLAMPDHLHALLAFPRQEDMEQVVRNLKRFIAKQAAVKWQDGFFDHRLGGEENFQQKAHYIRMNPVRAGLTANFEKWAYVFPAYDSETAR
jgi:putative transposase